MASTSRQTHHSQQTHSPKAKEWIIYYVGPESENPLPVAMFYGTFAKSDKFSEWYKQGSASIAVEPFDQSSQSMQKESLDVKHSPNLTTFTIVSNSVGISAAFTGQKSHAFYFDQSSTLMVKGFVNISTKNGTKKLNEGRHGLSTDGIAAIMISNNLVTIYVRNGNIYLDQSERPTSRPLERSAEPQQMIEPVEQYQSPQPEKYEEAPQQSPEQSPQQSPEQEYPPQASPEESPQSEPQASPEESPQSESPQREQSPEPVYQRPPQQYQPQTEQQYEPQPEEYPPQTEAQYVSPSPVGETKPKEVWPSHDLQAIDNYFLLPPEEYLPKAVASREEMSPQKEYQTLFNESPIKPSNVDESNALPIEEQPSPVTSSPIGGTEDERPRDTASPSSQSPIGGTEENAAEPSQTESSPIHETPSPVTQSPGRQESPPPALYSRSGAKSQPTAVIPYQMPATAPAQQPINLEIRLNIKLNPQGNPQVYVHQDNQNTFGGSGQSGGQSPHIEELD